MKTALCAILVALVSLSVAAAATERITDFTSEITVEKSGDLEVRETIAVVAAGDQINHGIYRDFPSLYRSALGLNRRVAFDVLEVTRDGHSEPWHTQARDNGVRVYIGSSGQLVEHGPHVYTITYHTDRQLVQRPEFDELYWNVTGNQWAFPIDHAVAKITLPPGAVAGEINGYTGRSGTRGQNWRAAPAGKWSAVLETTVPLLPYEGFTISVEWQKGVVDANANHETLRDIALDNNGLVLALGGIAAVLLYYLIAWILIGRDPPHGTIIPLYRPPGTFSPAAVRYLAGLGRFDSRSFAASVIDLAVKGVLRIDQRSKGKFSLARKNGVDTLPLPQRKFYRALMGSNAMLAMDNTHATAFQAARKELQQSVQSEIDKRYFVRNLGWWLAGLLLSLAPAYVALENSKAASGAIFMGVWLSIWSFGVIALLSTVVSTLRSSNFLAAIPLALFSLPFVAGWFFGAFMLVKFTTLWIAAVFALGFLINAIFYHLLKAPTREGRRMMDEIEGFRRYLSIAEKDRLNLENPPERTPEHFEMFLPYALALDVEQKWSAQFSGILDAAQYQPDWYHGSGAGTFDFASGSFTSSLGGAFTSAIASSSTPPGSSSGSGGGGSSGGGGGGGGGGGW